MGAVDTFTTELLVDASKGVASVKEYDAALDKGAAKAKKAASANDDYTDSVRKVPAQLRMRQKAEEDVAKGLERLVRTQNPAAITARKLAKAESDLATARRRGIPITRDHTQAVQNLRNRMERQTRAANDNTRAANDNARAVTAMGGSFGKLRGAILAVQGLLAGAIIARGVRELVGGFASFEAKISEVRAVTGTFGADIEAMQQQARMLGATTQFSANQAADGMAFLGRAGFKTGQIMAALPGTLQLAAAGALDLGTAADIASNVLTGFGLAASDMDRVSDVLAKTAASANTSVEQLGAAMKFVAPVAASLGIDIEQAAAGIGKLSDAGLQGEMAGTGLRMALTSLVNPGSKAKEAIKSLGLSLEDVNPKSNTLSDILAKLAERGLGVEQAMTIAGARGGTALLALTRQAAGVADLTQTLREAEGAAREMALVMQDNLPGAAKRLMSVLGEVGLMLTGDSGFGGALRTLTDNLANIFLSWTQFSHLLGDDEAKFRGIANVIEGLGAGLLAYVGTLATVRVGTLAVAAANRIWTSTLVTARGATTAASAATLIFNAAIKANPIGLVAAGLATLVTAVVTYRQELGFTEAGINTYDRALGNVKKSIEAGKVVQEDQIALLRKETEERVNAAQATLLELESLKNLNDEQGGLDIVKQARGANFDENIADLKQEIQAMRDALSLAEGEATNLIGADLDRLFARMPELFNGAKTGAGAVTDELSKGVDKLAKLTSSVRDLEIRARSLFESGGPDGLAGAIAIQQARDLLLEMGKAAKLTTTDIGELEAKFGTSTDEIARLILRKQDLTEEINRATTGFDSLILKLDPVAGHFAGIAQESAILNSALDAGRISIDEHADLIDALTAKTVAWEKSQIAAAEAVARQADQLAANNEIDRITLGLNGANTAKTLELTQTIIDKREALALANVEMQRQQALLTALPKQVEGLNRSYDRLLEATRETFETKRVNAFTDANKSAARDFEDAWSGTISYIDGLFRDLFGGLTDKLGKLGGFASAVGSDIIRGLLPKGEDGNPISIGSLIAGGVKSVFSPDKAGGGPSLDPTSILSNVSSAIDGGFTRIGNAFSSIFTVSNGAFAAGTPAAATAFSGTGAAGLEAAGLAAGGGFGSAAISPLALGSAAAALVAVPALMALANKGDDGAAFGARLGVNDAGLLDIADVRTDDGFPAETAQQIAESVQGLSNAFLGANGLTLTDGAFRGEVAFNNRLFKASADAPRNAAFEMNPGLDATGIMGLNLDSRRFDNVNQATADFVARNLFLAIEEGAVEGLSGDQSDAFKVGLGNLIRRVRDDVTGEEDGLDVFTRRLDALSTFARLRENLDSVAVSADDAAARLAAAAESQAAYGKALETVRTEAKAAAVSGLSGLGDFIDDLHVLFDPTGGDETQLRLRLREGADNGSGFPNGGLTGGLDVVNAGVIDSFFDSENGVNRSNPVGGFDAAGAAKLDQIDGPNGGSAFYQNGGAFFDRFNAFGVGFTNTGGSTPFGENGEPNSFTGGNGSVRFDSPTTGGGYNLTIDARQLVKALTGSDTLDFGEAILDPLFAKGTELIVDSFRVARARVDEYLNSFTGDSGLQGPAQLFEEIVPAVSPMVEQFEALKAQIEATRPDLEALNEDFKKFGVSLIDVDGKINGAIDAVTQDAQDQFLAGLGIRFDSETGQVQTGIDYTAINALATNVKGLDATAGTYFEGIDLNNLPTGAEAGVGGNIGNPLDLLGGLVDAGRGIDPKTVADAANENIAAGLVGAIDPLRLQKAVAAKGGIDDVLATGIQQIVAAAPDPDAAIAAIQEVFGDRVADMDFAAMLEPAETSIEDFAQGIQAATALIEEQIRAQEQVVDGLSRAVDSLRDARNAINLDPTLSILSPLERVARSQTLFDETAAKALSGDLTAQENLGSIAEDYLGIAREVHASTSTYADIFRSVDGVLGQVESAAVSELSVARDQLSVLEEIRDGMAELGGPQPSNGRYPVRNEILRTLTGFTEDFGGGRFGAFLDQIAAPQSLRDQIAGIAAARPFADGGIMTPGGPLALNTYSAGGIANGPQLALFGEGRMNEAFVPLPDGRSIPVTMNDNSPAALVAEVKELRKEIARLGQTTAAGAIRVADKVEEGTAIQRRDAAERQRAAFKPAETRAA